ncbi:MAG TPA: alpha/beta hydrolase family protein [Pyrinomonadaceae bacterium]|nr:alpha/beta hydrolase family protein [Pyrinomonadaceae bacterium]
MRRNQVAQMRYMRAFVPGVLLVTTLFLIASAAGAEETRKVDVQTIQFKSELIGKVLPYNALLPVGYAQSNKRYPVLYLLHGLFGHYDDWVTRTNLAEYAVPYDVIVITPEGHDNWYTDSAAVPTDKYDSYFIRELISDVDARFRTIKDRRARGVAGLSMGGYGALKYGFKHPDLFAFAGSLSGALDPTTRSEAHPGFAWDILRSSVNSVFGPPDSQTRKANDIHQIARSLTATQVASLPFIYFDCGLDDGFLATNRELADVLLAQKIPHQYCQLPGGHNWAYWDQQVREVLRLYAQLMLSNLSVRR